MTVSLKDQDAQKLVQELIFLEMDFVVSYENNNVLITCFNELFKSHYDDFFIRRNRKM